MKLLEDLRQERTRSDIFLNPNNPRTCFLRGLYFLMDTLEVERERQCWDNIHSYIASCRMDQIHCRPSPDLPCHRANVQPAYDQSGHAGQSFAQGPQQPMFTTNRSQALFPRASSSTSPFTQPAMVQPPTPQRMPIPQNFDDLSNDSFLTYTTL